METNIHARFQVFTGDFVCISNCRDGILSLGKHNLG